MQNGYNPLSIPRVPRRGGLCSPVVWRVPKVGRSQNAHITPALLQVPRAGRPRDQGWQLPHPLFRVRLAHQGLSACRSTHFLVGTPGNMFLQGAHNVPGAQTRICCTTSLAHREWKGLLRTQYLFIARTSELLYQPESHVHILHTQVKMLADLNPYIQDAPHQHLPLSHAHK